MNVTTSAFPPKTKVRLYERSNWQAAAQPPRPGTEPIGRSLGTSTVRKDGTVSLSGAKDGGEYYAAGEVDGKMRYVHLVAKK